MKMSLMSLVHTVADALSKAPVDSAEREMQVGAWKGAYLPCRIEGVVGGGGGGGGRKKSLSPPPPPPPEIELEAISKYNILYTYFNRKRNLHINSQV
jgi:hypothetical protein